MTRLAFALPVELEERLFPDAVRHGHDVVARCADARELGEAIEALRPQVAVVSGDPRYLTASVLATADARGTRILALVDSAAQRQHVSVIGLRETAETESSWPELESMLDAQSAVPTVASPARGRVITVWGPGGAPGRTSVAITLAAELAAVGHRVVLADVDTHAASVAPALGLLDEAPGFAAACRLVGSDSLTAAELDRLAQTYESPAGSFRVLTGIGRPSRWPELTAERVADTIDACRRWAEIVVLDTSSSLESDEEISSDLFAPRRNAATIAAVGAADQVVVVGSADPVGMSRLLRAHPDLMETARTADVTVVMNRVRATAIGLNPSAQVSQTLARFGGIQSPTLVPFDHVAFDAAMLGGRTITDAMPRSPARVALRDLAARLVPSARTRGRRRR